MTFKRAFTLIELLVVIAIIAILAAILFPVFAQAKTAAKKTASLSNHKQVSMGMIMYAGDADDNLPLTFYPGNGLACTPGATFPNWNDTTQLPCSAAGGQVPGWPKLSQPYIKSWDLFRDPTVGDTRGIYSGDYAWWFNWARFSHYGYNWVYLAPSFGDDATGQRTYSTSSLGAPADTVLIVDSRSYDDEAQKWTSGYLVVDPPTAINSDADVYWFGGWDSVSPDPRYQNGFNVSWADGHARFDKVGRLQNDELWDRL